jgi:hypothetical protein
VVSVRYPGEMEAHPDPPDRTEAAWDLSKNLHIPSDFVVGGRIERTPSVFRGDEKENCMKVVGASNELIQCALETRHLNRC